MLYRKYALKLLQILYSGMPDKTVIGLLNFATSKIWIDFADGTQIATRKEKRDFCYQIYKEIGFYYPTLAFWHHL